MTLVRSKPAPTRQATIRYADDSHGWALEQAAMLRSGRLDEIDTINIADEIADVAGRASDKLESAFVRVIQHLLKWDHQPERRSRSWALSIEEHRSRASTLLRKHPGLKAEIDDLVVDAYAAGRYAALRETRLPKAAIPEANPYSWDEIMDREIAWPET